MTNKAKQRRKKVMREQGVSARTAANMIKKQTEERRIVLDKPMHEILFPDVKYPGTK